MKNYRLPNDLVLWYKGVIESFGGEFPIIRVEPSANHHGRRNDSILKRRRPLNPDKYYVDDNGSVRRR